jgi:aminoglycoside 6'-N-acetyltransferase I
MHKAGLVIRPLAEHDVAAWAPMRAQLWPEADASELAREAAAFLAAPAETALIDAVFVADRLGEVIGFLELAVRAFSDGCDSMPVPHVEGWYVSGSERSRGVGRALIAAAANWARERGFTELASDTEVSNERSQHAHTACGFEEVDRLVKYRMRLTDAPQSSRELRGPTNRPAF